MTANDPLAEIARELTAERFAKPTRRSKPALTPIARVTFIDPPDVVRARIAAMNAEMSPNYNRDAVGEIRDAS